MKLSIIIPTFNEERTVRKVINSVRSVHYPCDYEIIVVDDGSSDRTYEKQLILRYRSLKGEMKLFHSKTNKGKGAAIREGLSHAKGDFVVIQDADKEYDPKDISKLLDPVLKGEADAVFGSRFLLNKHPNNMAFPNWIANKILTGLANLLYQQKLTDVFSCYKIMNRVMLKEFNLKCDRFESEAEIVGKLLKKNVRIKELPIAYDGRTYKEGKKIRAWDLFLSIFALIRVRFEKKI